MQEVYQSQAVQVETGIDSSEYTFPHTREVVERLFPHIRDGRASYTRIWLPDGTTGSETMAAPRINGTEASSDPRIEFSAETVERLAMIEGSFDLLQVNIFIDDTGVYLVLNRAFRNDDIEGTGHCTGVMQTKTELLQLPPSVGAILTMRPEVLEPLGRILVSAPDGQLREDIQIVEDVTVQQDDTFTVSVALLQHGYNNRVSQQTIVDAVFGVIGREGAIEEAYDAVVDMLAGGHQTGYVHEGVRFVRQDLAVEYVTSIDGQQIPIILTADGEMYLHLLSNWNGDTFVASEAAELAGLFVTDQSGLLDETRRGQHGGGASSTTGHKEKKELSSDIRGNGNYASIRMLIGNRIVMLNAIATGEDTVADIRTRLISEAQAVRASFQNQNHATTFAGDPAPSMYQTETDEILYEDEVSPSEDTSHPGEYLIESTFIASTHTIVVGSAHLIVERLSESAPVSPEINYTQIQPSQRPLPTGPQSPLSSAINSPTTSQDETSTHSVDTPQLLQHDHGAAMLQEVQRTTHNMQKKKVIEQQVARVSHVGQQAGFEVHSRSETGAIHAQGTTASAERTFSSDSASMRHTSGHGLSTGNHNKSVAREAFGSQSGVAKETVRTAVSIDTHSDNNISTHSVGQPTVRKVKDSHSGTSVPIMSERVDHSIDVDAVTTPDTTRNEAAQSEFSERESADAAFEKPFDARSSGNRQDPTGQTQRRHTQNIGDTGNKPSSKSNAAQRTITAEERLLSAVAQPHVVLHRSKRRNCQQLRQQADPDYSLLQSLGLTPRQAHALRGRIELRDGEIVLVRGHHSELSAMSLSAVVDGDRIIVNRSVSQHNIYAAAA